MRKQFTQVAIQLLVLASIITLFLYGNKQQKADKDKTYTIPRVVQYYVADSKDGKDFVYEFDSVLWGYGDSRNTDRELGKFGREVISKIHQIPGVNLVQTEPYYLRVTVPDQSQFPIIKQKTSAVLRELTKAEVRENKEWKTDSPKPWEIPEKKSTSGKYFFVTFAPRSNDHCITLNFDEEVGGEVGTVWFTMEEVRGKLSKPEFQKIFDELRALPGVTMVSTYKNMYHIVLTRAIPWSAQMGKINEIVEKNIPGIGVKPGGIVDY